MNTPKPYPAYRDSGVEMHGQIPSHWSKVALRYLGTKFGSGLTPRGGASTYVKDGVLFLRSQNVHFDGLRLDDVAHISEDTDVEMASSRVRTNDVLLNITGASIGRCCVVPKGIGRANVNQHVCIIRPSNTRVDSTFLYNYLRSGPTQTLIQQVSTGAAREGLTLDELKAFPVPLPPLDEQRAIADFLDAMDARITRFIAARKKMIRLLEEKKQAVINQAVTKGLDPTVPMKDSGVDWLGEIPAHWEVRRSRYVFREVDHRATDDSLPRLSMSQKYGLVPNTDIESWRLQSMSAVGAKIVEHEDLVLNRLKAHLAVFAHAPLTGTVSPDYTVLRPIAEANVRYFEALYKTPRYRDEFFKRTKGIVEGFWRLYTDAFYSVPVPWPNAREQQEIVDYIDELTADTNLVTERATREVELVEEYRIRLISDVVTGKLDVRGVDLGELPEFEEIPISEEMLEPDGNDNGLVTSV